MGHWYDIKPNRVRASYKPERWVFAQYMEFPSQRDDSQWYRAYLFRDEERSVFGAAVFVGEDLPKLEARAWATRVVIDEAFRKKHITTDEALIKLWKRH